MLKSTERILKTESGELSLPDEEKVEALTTLRIDHRRGEVLRGEHVDRTMQASPNFRKAWAVAQVAGHLCSGRIHFLQMEKAARRGGVPPFAPLEETLATQGVAQNNRRIRIQDLV